MPLSPLPSELRVDQFASNILEAKLQPDSDFVYDRVFATLPQDKPSGLYYVYPQDAWTTTSAQVLGPSAPAPSAEMHVSQGRFDCQIIGQKTMISRDIEYQVNAPVDLKRDAVALLARRMRIKKELMFVQAFIRPGVWTGFNGGDFDVGNQLTSSNPNGVSRGFWSDFASDPRMDLRLAIDTNFATTGLAAKDLMLTRDVYSALTQHPRLLDLIKYTEAAYNLDDEALLAKALGVNKIYVMNAIFNSAQEGQALNLGFMTRNCALLVHKTDTPGILTASAGYQFAYTGNPYVGGLTGYVESWYDYDTRSTVMAAYAGVDFRVVASDCGVFFKNVLRES